MAPLLAAGWLLLAAATAARAAEHWAFQPVQNPSLPAVLNDGWPANDIDRFILAELERRNLRPSPPADRYALLRRATFDLIGLPPTPEEIDAFVNDPLPGAFARVVDRLLASPHYGERWGRHWLDLARYADTAGDSADYPVPQAHQYRDYVIASFNRDKPYDQFLKEQLAGDLLPSAADRERRERIVATGFLALARRFSVEPDNAMHLTIEDTLDTIGRAVLGLSFSCARCHDHKYDPISMRDYYGLYGIFSSTRFAYAGSEEKRKQRDFVPLATEEELEQVYKPLQRERDALEAEIKRLKKEVQLLAREGLDMTPAASALETAQEKLKQLEEHGPRLRSAYAVAEKNPADAKIHLRGEPHRPGDAVPRGTLDLLGKALRPALSNSPAPRAAGSGRLELAEWLTDAKNPLTPRVLANQVWKHHFGKGLVSTAGDFGSRGEEPTHPALLDYLATQLIHDRWSIKALHRRIMLSSTYAQSSFSRAAEARFDPSNQWLSRMNRRRLEAEAVRDAMLSISGAIDLAMAVEHPFPDPDEWDWTQHNPFTAIYPSSHRSVYVMQGRIRKHPFFATFDGADPNVTTAERTVSITPLQALFLMNDAFAHEQASQFAERIHRKGSTTLEGIRHGYLLAFGRPPSADELLSARQFLEKERSQPPGAADPTPDEDWNRFARALMASSEFIFLD